MKASKRDKSLRRGPLHRDQEARKAPSSARYSRRLARLHRQELREYARPATLQAVEKRRRRVSVLRKLIGRKK